MAWHLNCRSYRYLQPLILDNLLLSSMFELKYLHKILGHCCIGCSVLDFVTGNQLVIEDQARRTKHVYSKVNIHTKIIPAYITPMEIFCA